MTLIKLNIDTIKQKDKPAGATIGAEEILTVRIEDHVCVGQSCVLFQDGKLWDVFQCALCIEERKTLICDPSKCKA